MSERHALPGVFLTASLDDAHQLLTIKLSYPSYSNQAFPGFADAMHEREGSQAHESAKLSAEQRTRELQGDQEWSGGASGCSGGVLQ